MTYSERRRKVDFDMWLEQKYVVPKGQYLCQHQLLMYLYSNILLVIIFKESSHPPIPSLVTECFVCSYFIRSNLSDIMFLSLLM